MNRGILIIFLVYFFISGAGNVLAISPSVGVSVTPESVAPGDLVTIKLESFSTDLNRAEIIWTVDGTVLLQGVGQKEYSLRAKGLGEQTKVEITINTTNVLKAFLAIVNVTSLKCVQHKTRPRKTVN